MVRTIPPLLGAGVRFVVAGALVCAFVAARRGFGALRFTRQQFASAALIGVLMPAGGNGIVTLAEKQVPSGMAALLIASVPLWVAIYRIVDGQRVRGGTVAGLVLGFSGVALLLLPGGRPSGAHLAGILLVLVAAASWASGAFLSPRVPLPDDPFANTGVEMLIGGVVLCVAGLAAGEAPDFVVSSFSAESIGGLLPDLRRIDTGVLRVRLGARPRARVEGRDLCVREPGDSGLPGLGGAERGRDRHRADRRNRDRGLGGDDRAQRVSAGGGGAQPRGACRGAGGAGTAAMRGSRNSSRLAGRQKCADLPWHAKGYRHTSASTLQRPQRVLDRRLAREELEGLADGAVCFQHREQGRRHVVARHRAAAAHRRRRGHAARPRIVGQRPRADDRVVEAALLHGHVGVVLRLEVRAHRAGGAARIV